MRFFPALHSNRPAEIFDYALELGVFTKGDGAAVKVSTARCFFNGDELGVGRKEVTRKLAEELDLQQAVEDAVRTAIMSRQGVFNGAGSA